MGEIGRQTPFSRIMNINSVNTDVIICIMTYQFRFRVFSKIKGFAQSQFLPKFPFLSFKKALVVRH